MGYKSVPNTHIVRKSTLSLTKIILSFGVYEANIEQITVQPLKISKARYRRLAIHVFLSKLSHFQMAGIGLVNTILRDFVKIIVTLSDYVALVLINPR